MTSVTGRTREVPAKTDPAIPGPPRGSVRIDVSGLKRALRRAVQGEVRFDPGALALYANDASNFRQVPIGVVVPKTLDDVVAAHRVCSEFGAPILNRGDGTSLSGETVNHAVVIDHSKYLSTARRRLTPRRLLPYSRACTRARRPRSASVVLPQMPAGLVTVGPGRLPVHSREAAGIATGGPL